MARRQLALVALVQVLVLSLWFSASAVLPALRVEWSLDRTGGIWLTATVQVGFAVGAVASAALNLADRVPPQVSLAASAGLGAIATASITVGAHSAWGAVPFRLLTGVAMAGVYPVGLKIVVSWYPRARGRALGVLVGALSLGSALPQLLTTVPVLQWRHVLLGASALAVLGAVVALAFVRVGPDTRPAPPLNARYVMTMFADRPQRLINIGYFGHMWELYALWAWLPAYVAAADAMRTGGTDSQIGVGATAFAVIGLSGAAGCVLGGRLAERHGSVRVARAAMLLSATCAIGSVAVFSAPPPVLIGALLVWGAAVVADSAQFSAALTEVADPRYLGTALTAQTAIGFLLTVVTIAALPPLADVVGWRWAIPILSIGPLLGAVALSRLIRSTPPVTLTDAEGGLPGPAAT
jgi:MFS family permease